jgi:hypothetical protein
MLFITSCSEKEQLTAPNADFDSQITNTDSKLGDLYSEKAIRLDMIPVWINMPTASTVNLKGTFITSKLVFNNHANNVIIDTFYIGGLFDTVRVKMNLMFMPGDLQQDSMLVTAELNINDGTIKFGPPAVFNEPIRLDYKITGLDFSVMDPLKLRFIFAGDNGIIEPVICDGFTIKESDGSIQMWQGKIPHFSRYGFVRRGFDY